MSNLVELQKWVAASSKAVENLALTILCASECRIEAVEGLKEWDLACGGYIPILSSDDSVQIGVGGSIDSCELLSKSLLGLEEDDPSPEPDEVRDGMGEVANIVAGDLKSILVDEYPDLKMQLGLPFFVYGRIVPLGGHEHHIAKAYIDSIEIMLHVMRKDPNAGRGREAA